MVFNLATVLWYNPTLDQDCPAWVYASCALGLFLYQTFDSIDGMQAYGSPEAWRQVLSVSGDERDRAGLWASCSIIVSG